MKIFVTFQIANFSNFPKLNILWICAFSEFFKLTMFGIFQNGDFWNSLIVNFWNRPNYKINNFLECFQFGKQNFTPKIGNFEIFLPFDIPHCSQYCQFSSLPFDINQFSQFLFPILVTRKFGRSTFERWLILKFETSDVLKLYCLKFCPSPPFRIYFNVLLLKY